MGLFSRHSKVGYITAGGFYAITALFMILFFTIQWNGSAAQMYWLCAGLGFGTGFWAIFVTMAAEQFGTNIRATAATTVPNMVRGSLNLITLLFASLQTSYSYTTAGWITGAVVMVIAIVSAFMTEETFHKDLNYIEE